MSKDKTLKLEDYFSEDEDLDLLECLKRNIKKNPEKEKELAEKLLEMSGAQDIVKHRIEEIEKAKNIKTAGDVSVKRIFRTPTNESPQLYRPVSAYTEAWATIDLQRNLEYLKHNFAVWALANNKSTEESKNDIGKSVDVNKEQVTKKQNDADDKYRSIYNKYKEIGLAYTNTDRLKVAMQLGQSAVEEVLHQATAGIITSTNPTYSDKWKEFGNFRNEWLNHEVNDPSRQNFSEQLKRFEGENKGSFLSQEQFNELWNWHGKQKENATEKHKEYLEKLEKAVKEANNGILKKIGDDTQSSDDLNKYRIIQLLLLLSPILPIPFVGVILNAFGPLLSGALDIPDFLGSFFSVDGPFGDMAWLTDKMEIDKAVEWVGHLLDGPLSIAHDLAFNDITSPIYETLGAGLEGSPLSGLVLSALFEACTGSISQDIDRYEKAKKIVPDAEKAFEVQYKNLRSDELKRLDGQDEKYIEEELDFRKDIFMTKTVSDWLGKKFKSSPESCKALLENLFKDEELNSVDGKKIIDEAQYGGGDLTGKFYKLKDTEGFKTMLKLMQVSVVDDKKNDIGKSGNVDSPQNVGEVGDDIGQSGNIAPPQNKNIDKISSIFGFDGELGELKEGADKAPVMKNQKDLITKKIKEIDDKNGFSKRVGNFILRLKDKPSEKKSIKNIFDGDLLEIYKKAINKKELNNDEAIRLLSPLVKLVEKVNSDPPPKFVNSGSDAEKLNIENLQKMEKSILLTLDAYPLILKKSRDEFINTKFYQSEVEKFDGLFPEKKIKLCTKDIAYQKIDGFYKEEFYRAKENPGYEPKYPSAKELQNNLEHRQNDINL